MTLGMRFPQFPLPRWSLGSTVCDQAKMLSRQIALNYGLLAKIGNTKAFSCFFFQAIFLISVGKDLRKGHIFFLGTRLLFLFFGHHVPYFIIIFRDADPKVVQKMNLSFVLSFCVCLCFSPPFSEGRGTPLSALPPGRLT